MVDFIRMQKKQQRYLLLALSLVLLTIGAYNVMQYANMHYYEEVENTQFQGIYFNTPHPMLRLDDAFVSQDFSPYVLLTGPKQTGAQSIMEQLEDQFGSFNGNEFDSKAV